MTLHHVTNRKRMLRMIAMDKQFQFETLVSESETGNNLASLMT